jgi:alkaline phosphatase D
MWDDHDYGPNDGDATSPGRQASRLTYQEYVPHYPLAAGSGNVPIYQAFTIGRVRFILTDTRSERDTVQVPPDDPNKSMLGAAQKAWFKQQLLAANGVYPLIIWVCTSPWMADMPGSGTDNWYGFQAERRELANFIEANEIKGLLCLGGDVHMTAIDNGLNNRYADSGKPSFPILQASSLDRPNPTFLPANTYSEGQFPGSGQFGLVTVTDTGADTVTVTLNGRNHLNETFTELTLTMPLPPRFSLSQPKLFFLAVAGGDISVSHTFTVINYGPDVLSWHVELEPNVPWLTVSPTDGTTDEELCSP